jgi:hypothetical protein
MASPLEQNKRHALVLKAFIRTIKSAPEIADYRSYVIVSSKARIDRPKKFDTSLVVKADRFLSVFEKDLDSVSLFSLLGAMFSEDHVRPTARIKTIHSEANGLRGSVLVDRRRCAQARVAGRATASAQPPITSSYIVELPSKPIAFDKSPEQRARQGVTRAARDSSS